jgi:hypothetical protein
LCSAGVAIESGRGKFLTDLNTLLINNPAQNGIYTLKTTDDTVKINFSIYSISIVYNFTSETIRGIKVISIYQNSTSVTKFENINVNDTFSDVLSGVYGNYVRVTPFKYIDEISCKIRSICGIDISNINPISVSRNL